MNVTNSCPPHVLFLTGVGKLSSALQAWTDASRCLHSTALLDYCWHLTGGLWQLGYLWRSFWSQYTINALLSFTQRPWPPLFTSLDFGSFQLNNISAWYPKLVIHWIYTRLVYWCTYWTKFDELNQALRFRGFCSSGSQLPNWALCKPSFEPNSINSQKKWKLAMGKV